MGILIPLMEADCAANWEGSVVNTMKKALIECQAALVLKGLTEKRLTDVAACDASSRRGEVIGFSRGFTPCNPVPSVVKIFWGSFPGAKSR
jgi:hypothetical protein